MNKKLYLTIAVLLILSFILCSCRKEAQIVPAPTNTVESDLVILQPDLSLPDEYYTHAPGSTGMAFLSEYPLR